MNKLIKFINAITGKKNKVVKTPRELLIEKIKTIEANEPETIDTLIPPCGKCVYCITFDQTISAYRGKIPKCNRPTGNRIIVNKYIDGVSSSYIERNYRDCATERDFGAMHPGTSLVYCGRDAIFFKQKV